MTEKNESEQMFNRYRNLYRQTLLHIVPMLATKSRSGCFMKSRRGAKTNATVEDSGRVATTHESAVTAIAVETVMVMRCAPRNKVLLDNAKIALKVLCYCKHTLS